jgi:phosphocarrier protein HPr
MADDVTNKAAEAQVTITHDVGLHARPSVKLTKLAKGYGSQIKLALAEGGPWIDAKSIVKVMATKAPRGATLFLRAEGEDAREALDALVSLVARDFDEGDTHANTA